MPVVRIVYVVICVRLFVPPRKKMMGEKIDLDAELKGTRTAGAVIWGDGMYVQSPPSTMRKVPARYPQALCS
jgi:hypothetical protein